MRGGNGCGGGVKRGVLGRVEQEHPFVIGLSQLPNNQIIKRHRHRILKMRLTDDAKITSRRRTEPEPAKRKASIHIVFHSCSLTSSSFDAVVTIIVVYNADVQPPTHSGSVPFTQLQRNNF